MSLQADLSFRILMLMYVEFDKRSGWSTHQQVVAAMKKDGVGEGRADDALAILHRLKMLQSRKVQDIEQIKISSYGVQWLEKSCPLISRDPVYEFDLPIFGSVKLVGPDEFFSRGKAKGAGPNSTINWTKWGTILGAISILVAIVIAVNS